MWHTGTGTTDVMFTPHHTHTHVCVVLASAQVSLGAVLGGLPRNTCCEYLPAHSGGVSCCAGVAIAELVC